MALDEIAFHEVLDRLSIIQNTLNDYVIENPVVKETPDLLRLVHDADDKLQEAYQLCGRIRYNLPPNPGEAL